MRNLSLAALAVFRRGCRRRSHRECRPRRRGGTEQGSGPCSRPIVGGKPIRFSAPDGWPLSEASLLVEGRPLLYSSTTTKTTISATGRTPLPATSGSSQEERLPRPPPRPSCLGRPTPRAWGCRRPPRPRCCRSRSRAAKARSDQCRLDRQRPRRSLCPRRGAVGAPTGLAGSACRPHGLPVGLGIALTSTGRIFGNLDGKTAVRRLRVPAPLPRGRG